MEEKGWIAITVVSCLLRIMIMAVTFVACGPQMSSMFKRTVSESAVGEGQASLSAACYGGGNYPSDCGPVPAAGGTDIPNQEPYDLTFFKNYGVNPFIATEDENFSTFGMDVDNAAYTVCRRFIQDGNLPDADSVRTEEFINYFKQDYQQTPGTARGDAFTIHIDGAQSHFGNSKYHLVRIGIKANEVTIAERKPANLLFVVDVSGSMEMENRLGLVKSSLNLLCRNLKPGDQVGLVVYGNQGRKLLDYTSDIDDIENAIDRLRPEGATNAEEGLRIAYAMARSEFDRSKINRIVLCSDGVANVGNTGASEIFKQIKKDAEKGITLTALGFGMGNYNDVLMEQLASHGDGNYYYLDTKEEAERLFSGGAVSLLQVVAENARIQVEFNPLVVDRFRLLGYENRTLDKEDFHDDKSEKVQTASGEIGAGQTVTALYEVRIKETARAEQALATVRVRYNNLETHRVAEQEQWISVAAMNREFSQASADFRFCAAVAEYAEILKNSYWAKDGSLAEVLTVATAAVGEMDADDQEREFINLVGKTIRLKDNRGL